METHQPQPTRTEVANSEGACAEFSHGLNGPILKILVFDPNPKGVQYVDMTLTYGKQTITQEMANESGKEQLQMLDIRLGPPETPRYGLGAITSLLRLKRMNRDQTQLYPVLLAEGVPSAYEKFDPPPIQLPTSSEIEQVVNVLREQADKIEAAVNSSVPVAPADLLLGRVVQGIARGLSEREIDAKTKPINKVFNPPPVGQLINILQSVETRKDNN